MSRECAEHFVDGKRAWQVGLPGFFSRIRGILAASLVTVATMGVPWWWPSDLPQAMTLQTKPTVLLVGALLGGLLVGGLLYLRWRSRRSLRVKDELHRLMHGLRNQVTRHATAVLEEDADWDDLEQHFRRDLVDACNHVARYFGLLFRDPTVGASIRLAVPDEEAGVVYKTVARSRFFNAHRAETSEPLRPDRGLVRFMRDKGKKGILVYHDLHAAAKQELFTLSRNDELYPEEIQSMMVAPLNGWDGAEENMFGLLYVTSSRKRRFDERYTDSFLAISDAVATALSGILCVHA